MDGVLVDVTESYRATIQATVKHFTGYEPPHEEIQDWKNRGGWNDDWQLSTRMIQERGGKTLLRRSRRPLPEDLPWRRQSETGGLILREQWLAANGLFDRLGETPSSRRLHRPPAREANMTLTASCRSLRSGRRRGRCARAASPTPKVCTRSALRTARKLLVRRRHGRRRARASAAGVPFIGIAAQGQPALRRAGPPAAGRRRRRRPRRHQLPGGRHAARIAPPKSSATPKKRRSRATPHRRPRPLRNLHRHPLPRPHAGALHQTRRLRPQAHAKGDLDVDQHHTVEDVGIVIGQLFSPGAGRSQRHQPRRLLRAADG